MIAIATSELRLLIRNRLVALCALLIPLGVGVFLVINPVGAGAGMTSVLQVMMMASLGVYLTATTTLAARRQNLVLKRLRSGTLRDSGVLAGLIWPIVLVNLVQVTAVLIALAFTSAAPPEHLWLMAIAVLAIEVMFVGFALATAGVTNSAEHAQFTTIPLLFVALAAAVIPMLNGGFTDSVAGWAARIAPGGAAGELLAASWGGPGVVLDLGEIVLLLGITLAWAALGALAARWLFRWEPRR